MLDWRLKRFAYTPKGTFGILQAPGLENIFTIEQDWENNKPFHSCIPIGTYEMDLYVSPARNTEVILLSNDDLLSMGDTDGIIRNYIELHVANWMKDIKGCIGPGSRLGNSWNVMNSRVTMNLLIDSLRMYPDSKLVISNRVTEYDGIPL